MFSEYRSMSSDKSSCPPAITLDNINPNVRRLEYAVRGPIVIRATQLEQELKEGVKKPFSEVIRCNIGDCQAMMQPPITFLRQIMACCVYPPLLEDTTMPEDVKKTAKRILDSCSGHSVGAYSASTGVEVIRKDVAAYIEARDHLPSDFNNIFLTTGASDAIKVLLEIISTAKEGKERAGIMVPIPQYPLYSATNAEYNAYQINYYLDEDRHWSMELDELERALAEARDHCWPRAIVVINPGNPTGQVLTREAIENVIRFAHKHRLFILADEVYQHNVYASNREFHSFKRVLHDLGPEYCNSVELASFMSCSKGFMGECGFRGGYCELTNMDLDVRAQVYKCLSAKLCSSVVGQAMMGAVVNPPKPGDPSYETFTAEKSRILSDLKEKAKLTTETFNSMPGFHCNEVQGAMYAFPRLDLPQKAIDAAKEKGMPADTFYCFALLEEYGVCVIPGSGFGQKPGTYHFRNTILPPVDKMKIVMSRIREFHTKFMERYA